MRKVLLIAAVAATAILLDSGMASARGRKCGGRGGRHGGGCGGCGGYVAHGCGYGGGCGMGGGCGYGGWGGGYASGCASCGGGYVGGYAMAGGVGCPDGLCAVTGVATSSLAATVVVELPADATLTIDGEATTSTSSTRVFQSPDLEPGKTFVYTFKAQVERAGELQSVTRQVQVRAGEETRVSLTLPATSVASR